jgi:NUMOD3 motif.
MSRGMLGKRHTEATKQKISLSRIGKLTGEINPAWKGDNVTNKPLHKWLKKNLAKPKECEFCGSVKPLDLSNITGVYNREFHNWKYLCRSCHAKLDNKVNNIKWMVIRQ